MPEKKKKVRFDHIYVNYEGEGQSLKGQSSRWQEVTRTLCNCWGRADRGVATADSKQSGKADLDLKL